MKTTSKSRRQAMVAQDICVACGACTKVCPREALSIFKGCYAKVNADKCVGCGICAKTCPASCITIEDGGMDDEK